MSDEGAYRVEIDSIREAAASNDPEAGPTSSSVRRSWLGVTFDCCSTYTRIYRNREGTAYQGHCPKCGRRVRVAIGSNGTDARFFIAH